MSARALLVRGMLVGVAAAALAYLFATVFGEPQVEHALGFEDAHTMPGMAAPEIVYRTVQSTLGLGVAVLVYGAALGGIFALAFAFATDGSAHSRRGERRCWSPWSGSGRCSWCRT